MTPWDSKCNFATVWANTIWSHPEHVPFLCVPSLIYITKSMQGDCLWAQYTEQTAFAGKLAAKPLGSAFFPDSYSIIDCLRT